MQPSAQGIASLFMGNPGALAARVDQDRKTSPMGIPDDLRQLMALNIVTTENDAAKRQQALAQLQQMAPMGGEPPTVADSVRQQAQQKIQARMAQEMQKQQALQQMMDGLRSAQVPEGIPQPQRQPEPQGIDQAPVEFGMAGGGIVSFDGTQGSVVPKPRYENLSQRAERQMQEKGSIYDPFFGLPEEERKRRREEAERKAGNVPLDETARRDREALAKIARAIQEENAMAGSAIADVLSLIPRGLAGAYDTAVVRPMRALGIDAAYLSPKLTPDGANVESMTPFADIRRREVAQQQAASASRPSSPTRQRPGDVVVPMRPLPKDEAPSPAAPPKAKPPAQQVARDLPSALPQVQPPAPAPASIEQEGRTEQGVRNASEAERALREAEYERRVGKPDRTQLDRLIAEYERQKAAAEGPKAGFDALLEYLGQIAATPRGMSSFEAGAAGARGVRALEKERAATRAALTEKQIMLEREQMKADRDYAKEVFGVGDQAYDRAMKTNMDFFKQAGEDKRAAEQRAHALTMAELKLKNDKELARDNFEFSKRLRSIPQAQQESEKEKYINYLVRERKIPYDQAYEMANASAQRGASPGEQLRAAEYLSQYGEPSDVATGVEVARRVAGVPTAAAAGPKEGDKATSKSGKPIIFRNGRWEYQ